MTNNPNNMDDEQNDLIKTMRDKYSAILAKTEKENLSMNHLEKAEANRAVYKEYGTIKHAVSAGIHAAIAIAEQLTRQNNILSVISESMERAELDILFGALQEDK